jgi:hypothetical protein
MQVELAKNISSEFSYDYYRAAAGDWPDIKLAVPSGFYQRTVWVAVEGTGNWLWEGELVATLGGVPVFQMPYKANVGFALSPIVTFSYDWTGATSNIPEAILFNDIVGIKMLPFTFVACCDSVGLAVKSSRNPSGNFPRRFFGVRSQTIF